MSDISFKVQVNPEIVKQFNENKVNELLTTHKLVDLKGELEGDGISRREAKGIEYDTFTKLADADKGVITTASLIKFNDGKETPPEKVKKELERNLPPSFRVQGPASKDAGEIIFVQAKTGNTVKEAFTMVGGTDKNNDGKLNINNELNQNSMVVTNADAADLAGEGDDFATPDESMKFFLKKKGVNTADISVTSEKANPLNTKVGELLNGLDKKQ
jgi:hypothetical protein